VADKVDLTIYQGDDYAAGITVFEPDGTTAADLTGFTAQSQIRTSLNDIAPVAVADFATTIAGNVISITLSHDITKALSKPTYVWDLQVIDTSGWITTLLMGSVLVTKEVTKVYTAAV
jgi:hypothetical protein